MSGWHKVLNSPGKLTHPSQFLSELAFMHSFTHLQPVVTPLPRDRARRSWLSLVLDGVQHLLGAVLCRGAPAQVLAVRALLLPAVPAAATEQDVPQGQEGRYQLQAQRAVESRERARTGATVTLTNLRQCFLLRASLFRIVIFPRRKTQSCQTSSESESLERRI